MVCINQKRQIGINDQYNTKLIIKKYNKQRTCINQRSKSLITFAPLFIIYTFAHKKANPPACMQRIPCSRKEAGCNDSTRLRDYRRDNTTPTEKGINCARVAHAATHSTRVTACLRSKSKQVPCSQKRVRLLSRTCDKTYEFIR